MCNGDIVNIVLVNVKFASSAVVSQASDLTVEVKSKGTPHHWARRFTFEMTGLILQQLVLIETAGLRRTRSDIIFHDHFVGDQNNRNSYCVVTVPSRV